MCSKIYLALTKAVYPFYLTFADQNNRSRKLIIMPYLTAERKSSLFTEFGGSATNTGSIEAQIALLTEKITSISKHLQENKKDFSTNRGLMKMVGQRKRLLSYLSKHNLQGYRQLIEKLGLRK
jgi:small subunit ribosomal protein S15